MTQTILYNGALGTTPDLQGWLDFGTTPLISATQTAFPSLTHLNSPTLGAGGYSNYRSAAATLVNAAFPVLDRTIGFSLTFQLRINSESNSSDTNGDGLGDRAGFSLTALSSDRLGIELGFWTDEIWAQRGGTGSTLFTHSPTERAFVSTTTGLVNYTLLMLGDQYFLSTDNQVLLQGALQDYTAFSSVGSGLPYNPYTTSNFLFWGDNTSNGAASSDIGRLTLSTPTRGTAKADGLNGTVDEDLLNALAGNDSLSGRSGNDILIGGDGNDLLNGGRGNDRLLGGSNNDRFLYDTNSAFSPSSVGADTIFDFDAIEDLIVLDKTTFTALSSGNGNGFSNAAEFAIVTTDSAAKISLARIVYNTRTGGLFYNENSSTSGFGTGGKIATLLGESNSTASSLLSAARFLLRA
jgi:hypothetical protein